jgi:hypothetical protein
VDHLDTSVAHPARRYNYWLGGKDHFAADRESGDLLAAAFPTARIAARENRDFLRRSVRYLATAGIRQFLDIGTGLPVPDNTHEIAQRMAPDARVVYVDNDPIVMTHARALTVDTPPGRTGYIEADLREPESILGHPQLRDTLDLDQPVALLLVAVRTRGQPLSAPAVRPSVRRRSAAKKMITMGSVSTTEPAISTVLLTSMPPESCARPSDTVQSLRSSTRNSRANRNSFQAIMKTYSALAITAGAASGRMTLRMVCSRL